MDHIRIFNQIKDKRNLKRAFHYAYYDRIHSDFFFDYFEMEYVRNKEDNILYEINEELNKIENYTQRPAYSYYPPKNDLCFRRMIYIPFKDLVIRYAFVTVIADLIDNELSTNCFANRRAKGKQAEISLLENFSEESWPKFCKWQKRCLENNEVLLRTDISSFYDSISHDYLTNIIVKELSISIDSQVIKLFKKMLCIPVISYSQYDKKVQEPEYMKQGLPIGNSTEGFLANIYLKNIDDIMGEIKGIVFGRYNDDMRIFGKKRKDVLDAMLVLQELLLAKGLNLNAGKTQLAENKEDIEKLRTKFYDVSINYIEEEYEIKIKKNIIKDKIDRNFDEFDRKFNADKELENNGDARDYCKFLSVVNNKGEELLARSKRTPNHVKKLEEIAIKWAGSTRHAVWLIVQSAFYEGITKDTQSEARKIIFNLLRNDDVISYGKYRLIHHLIKLRRSEKKIEFRFLDKLSKKEKSFLIEIIPAFLGQSAFELNLIGLYLLRSLGSYDLKKYVKKYLLKPVGEPIKNALFYISEPTDIDELLTESTDKESDNIPSPY